jgi:hypothetical protein
MAKSSTIPGHFSVAPLLLAEADIPAQVREALLEERRHDAS